MTNCNSKSITFSRCQRRQIEVNFDGGDITSDGGALLLRQVDQKLHFTQQLAQALPDHRDPERIQHTLLSLIRQRTYAIACGYEDLNDHDCLRHDLGFQTAVGCQQQLASSATLCRFENNAERQTASAMHQAFFDQFIASFDQPPKELILDFDATDDPLHGFQEGRFFHGYYKNYCFLPLYVFCGKQLLVSYLRPSNIDAAKHSWAILSLLVKGIRKAFPEVNIIFRGDSGFCRHKMLRWCERHHVHYIVGIQVNKRLTRAAQSTIDAADRFYQEDLTKQRLFSEVRYAARSWGTERRILVKAEHTQQGANTRYVITNLEGAPQRLYDTLYCARGDMENRIKEQQLCLFADRTSCHLWWANQFRLLLSSAAYILVDAIRRIALPSTELAQAQSSTIRLKLLKIGGVILRNTRRVRFFLSSAYPYATLWMNVAAKLQPG